MAQASTTTAPLAAVRERIGRRAKAQAGATSFPELVWAHFLRQKELRERGLLHGEAEVEYRTRLEEFEREHGKILNAYWSTHEASAVAVTVKPPKSSAKLLGSLGQARFHAATDWATRETPDVADLLHKSETLAMKVSEVLRGTSERIALQWILAHTANLLAFVDRPKPRSEEATARFLVPRRAELARIEEYYHRVGEKVARIVYFGGMMMGVGILAIVALVGFRILSVFDAIDRHSPITQSLIACYAMGAVGALVSVMSRMASSKEQSFSVDYEIGRLTLRRLGAFRPAIGATFALVLFFALQADLLQIRVTSEDVQPIYFYLVVSFLAGFSERWAKVMLGGAERGILSGAGGDEAAQDRTCEGEQRPKGTAQGAPRGGAT